MESIEIFGSVIKLVDLAAQIAAFVKENSATTGEGANSATTGYGANSATTGYRANSATTGEGANSATTGYGANSATTGEGANSATTGEGAAAALGIHSRAKATVGGICVCDWVYDDDAEKWCLNGIYSAMVGGKILDTTIEPDTWYWFEDGKLHTKA